MEDKKYIPLVSICSITYNHAPYIRQCLEGFLMQKTNFAFEVIINDDYSTDGTTEILKEYAEKYPHIIKPIFQQENQYQKGVRGMFQNIVLPRARGKFVAICEGDDYWTSSTKLREQVNFMDNNPDYGMCYTNCDVIYQENNKIITNLLTQHNRIAEYKNLEDYIINRGYVAPPTWLYRREFLPSQSQKVKSVDGTFVYFAYFLAHTKVKFINCSTAIYRVLEESACHSKSYEKEYLREKNLLSVQLSLCEQYELPKDVSRRCEIGHYRHNLKRFIIYDKMEDVRHARKLIENKTIQERILFVVSSSKAGRRLLRIVYNNLRKFK